MKVPLCHYSDAPEESYLWTSWQLFPLDDECLTFDFKDPVGNRVGVELLFNSVEFGVPSSCQQTPRQLETRCGRESHTRPRGLSESPDGVDPRIRRTRKTHRDGHNSGVKIWSLCSVSITLSHANLEQPFRTLAINWEVNIFLKKSSCVFLHASFLLASLSLCRCELFYIYMCTYVDVNLHMWLYNNKTKDDCLGFLFYFILFYFLVRANSLFGEVKVECSQKLEFNVRSSGQRLAKRCF